MVTLDREPLGVMDAWMWAREPKAGDGHRGGIKESERWIEGYERVADREADILALLLKARELGHAADYLVRCQHDRALPGDGKLWSRLGQAPVLGQVSFELPGGRGRQARRVTQRIRTERIELDDAVKGRLAVSYVLAEEIDAPAGAKAVQTLEQAVELIDWYRARWEIELFFLILKEGCRIEALQLGNIERMRRHWRCIWWWPVGSAD